MQCSGAILNSASHLHVDGLEAIHHRGGMLSLWYMHTSILAVYNSGQA